MAARATCSCTAARGAATAHARAGGSTNAASTTSRSTSRTTPPPETVPPDFNEGRLHTPTFECGTEICVDFRPDRLCEILDIEP